MLTYLLTQFWNKHINIMPSVWFTPFYNIPLYYSVREVLSFDIKTETNTGQVDAAQETVNQKKMDLNLCIRDYMQKAGILED